MIKITPLQFDAVFLAEEILSNPPEPERNSYQYRECQLIAALLLNHYNPLKYNSVSAIALADLSPIKRALVANWIGAGCPSMGLENFGLIQSLEDLISGRKVSLLRLKVTTAWSWYEASIYT